MPKCTKRREPNSTIKNRPPLAERSDPRLAVSRMSRCPAHDSSGRSTMLDWVAGAASLGAYTVEWCAWPPGYRALTTRPECKRLPTTNCHWRYALIRSTLALASLGLPPLDLDLRLHKRRKPPLPAQQGAGWMINSACFQLATWLTSTTSQKRSRRLRCGRLM